MKKNEVYTVLSTCIFSGLSELTKTVETWVSIAIAQLNFSSTLTSPPIHILIFFLTNTRLADLPLVLAVTAGPCGAVGSLPLFVLASGR